MRRRVCSVLLCPLVHPPVCPFVRLFRLLCLSAHSSPSALPALSLRSFVSVRFACLPRPSICPSRSGAAEFYSADFAKCFVFSLRDDFSVPDF